MIKTEPHFTPRIFQSLAALAIAIGVVADVQASVLTDDGLTVAASKGIPAMAHASPTLYKTITVDGLQIFYREAGPKHAPTVILLHGFPASSFMYRGLMEQLAGRFHEYFRKHHPPILIVRRKNDIYITSRK